MAATLWALAPQAHVAAIDDDLVFLDIAADAYVCLRAAAADAVLSPDRRHLAIAAPDLVAELRSAGLIAPQSAATLRASGPIAEAPRRTTLQARYEPPSFRAFGDAMRCLADVLTTYRGRAFTALLDQAGRDRPHDPQVTPGLLAAVADFHRWSPYLPVSGKCLLRAYMLLRHLRRQGHDALWVFGVRTWPFHAHCWLQVEDLVLDDQPDRLAAFTPILVV